MRRRVNPRRLKKKFSIRNKYVYGFSTTLSCIPLCYHISFSVLSCFFSCRVRSTPVDAILKKWVFNLKTSGWFFQVLDRMLTYVNPWQCPFKSKLLFTKLVEKIDIPGSLFGNGWSHCELALLCTNSLMYGSFQSIFFFVSFLRIQDSSLWSGRPGLTCPSWVVKSNTEEGDWKRITVFY